MKEEESKRKKRREQQIKVKDQTNQELVNYRGGTEDEFTLLKKQLINKDYRRSICTWV